MVLVGLVITLAGFLLAVMSLGMATSAGVRLAMVVAGIAVSLFGMMGMLNPAYLKNAIWRK